MPAARPSFTCARNRALRHARLVFLLCLYASHGFALTLSAQDAMSAREREAKAAFDAGVEAAKAEDYARARLHFLRSRQLVVRASTLLNLAIADFKLGLVEEALFALDAIEAPAAGPEQERLRQRARQVRSEVEALRDNGAVQPTGALEAQDQAALVVPATAPPAAPEASAAPVAEGSVQTEKAAAPAPTRAPATASLFGPRALLWAGGALGAGAIGTGAWWSNRNDEADACHAPPEGSVSVCNEEGQIARQQTAAMAVTLSLGISAVALVTGGAIWLAQRKHDRRSGSLSASAWGDRSTFGLVARGSF